MLICDGVSGILVSPGDVEELAKGMERAWLMTDAERQMMGTNAQLKIKEFDPEITCPILEQWYQNFI